MQTVTVGTGTCGCAAGADKVLAEVRRQAAGRAAGQVAVAETGCIGMCYAEVLVGVEYALGN